MQTAAYIWAKVIGGLENRLGAITVAAWLDDAEPVELKDDGFVIHTPSDFRQEMILRNCKQHIEEILREILDRDVKLLVWSDAELESNRRPKDAKSVWKCNPHFSFDSYIAGPGNEMPLKAAMHVAEHVFDSAYNPLYFYGPPGVGKTHLLYAIANHISRENPGAKIVYVKGEQFTNELVQAILQSSTVAFKKKYREADVLLVDDIQFIAGKESTQLEFFHTFNNLYEQQKQIVLTSDRAPNDMPLLEERLRGRFGAGVMMKIQPPDLDTRKKIVEAKAAGLQLHLNGETVNYLAETLRDSVRQIEGGLRKIKAFRDLAGMPMNLANIAKTISDIHAPAASTAVTADTVVRYVCKYYGVEESQLKGKDRSRNITEPRQVAMYLIQELTKLSSKEIGRYFNRDHSTVHHSIQKVQSLLDRKDEIVTHILQEIRMNIEADT